MNAAADLRRPLARRQTALAMLPLARIADVNGLPAMVYGGDISSVRSICRFGIFLNAVHQKSPNVCSTAAQNTQTDQDINPIFRVKVCGRISGV